LRKFHTLPWSGMVNVTALKLANATRWANMHVRADRIAAFDATARRLCELSAKARYVGVTNRLRLAGYQPVPWWAIAVISEREYGGPPHWDRQLGQGDPLDQVSTHDPQGRGPFLDHPTDVTPGNDAWTRGCLDALIDCTPYAAKWSDWSSGGVLTLLEEYNGLGYAAMGVPSAYVWSGTDQYVSGKYVADHDYRAGVVDVQQGCAPIISRMMALDSSIVFGEPTATALPTPPPKPPVPPPPAPGFWATIISIFTRKV
jgi:lysozyme family protein